MSAAHSFVRVRPFTDAEARVCPEDSPVPREVLLWDDVNTITVLDAQNGFCPRKNGNFSMENILWSFTDPERADRVIHTQKDVYEQVVLPSIPKIVEGYNSAFLIAGAADSGRTYTLYGDDVDGDKRGIISRFAEDIFVAFKKQAQENSSLSAELEAVEVQNETYIDLFSQRRKSNLEELKLVPGGPSGPRLQGCTSVAIKDETDLMHYIRQLSRMVKKKSGTHTVSIRFVESFIFDDPENEGLPVTKSRRVQVLFVLLRNLPPAFQRCVDVAVEHDSGENPLAKVPVRETALTKLYPDLFQQGFYLYFISCLSPYYEHAREDLHTLSFATKVKKLIAKPKLNHDGSLIELRRLADEVKDLKAAVRVQGESAAMVQTELNAREVDLMKQEERHRILSKELAESTATNRLAVIGNHYELNRNRLLKAKGLKKITAERDSERKLTSEQAAQAEAIKKLKEEIQQTQKKISDEEKKINTQIESNHTLTEQLHEWKRRNDDLELKKRVLTASPEEQKKQILILRQREEAQKSEFLQKTLQEIQKDCEGCSAECKKHESEYQRILEEEKDCREKEALEKEIADLKREIEETEALTRRMRYEMAQKKAKCGCVMM